jgi:hypothetical protein
VLVNQNLHLFLLLQALSVYRVIFPGLNPKELKKLSVLALSCGREKLESEMNARSGRAVYFAAGARYIIPPPSNKHAAVSA